MSYPEPPPTETPTTCFFHTDRETGRRCTRCGRAACWECLHDAPVGSHCWECIKAAQPPRTEQVKRAVRGGAGDPMLVTKTLVGVNVAVFVLQLINGSSIGGIFSTSGPLTAFEVRWGLFDSAVAAGQWERLVTSGFIHFGVMHILFNMLILYRLGETMEAGIGRLRFTLIYTASLLAGSFGMVLWDARAVGGGASGAVFGLAAAATIGLWQRGVRFYNTGWGPLLLINLVLTFSLPNIGIGAHIGGLLVGGVLGWVMLHPRHALRNKTAGVALAVAITLVAGIGSVVVARNHYPECKIAQLEFNCTH